jgi:hypothetical protein
LNPLSLSVLCEILGHGSLRLESEDSLFDFISKGTEANQQMFGLLEFVRLEYCSTDVLNGFFGLLSEHLSEISASIWATLRARLVLPNNTRKQFLPSVKKGGRLNVPDGIIAHLTRECGGNVHDAKVVDISCGSFEKETDEANPHSGALSNDPGFAAENAADLDADSCFFSAYRNSWDPIPPTRNNWVCYDFKVRRIVPTHYAIRTYGYGPGGFHLKSWLVETSADGECWREVARAEGSTLNGPFFTAIFAVADREECRFIRLVNIGRNHCGNGRLVISAWEIFGSLFE